MFGLASPGNDDLGVGLKSVLSPSPTVQAATHFTCRAGVACFVQQQNSCNNGSVKWIGWRIPFVTDQAECWHHVPGLGAPMCFPSGQSQGCRDVAGTIPYHEGEFCCFTFALENVLLGPPVVPFYPFFGEGSPTKIDYRKKKVP